MSETKNIPPVYLNDDFDNIRKVQQNIIWN